MPNFLESVKGLVSGELNKLGQGNGQVSPYFRPTRLAHNVYDQSSAGLNNNTPYLGFQYFVKIELAGNVDDNHISKYFDGRSVATVSPVIKSVSLPSMEIDTDSLNEYNRYRINQQKINYQPIRIVFHDTTDGKVLRLWRMYYEYYFSDGKEQSAQIRDAEANPINAFHSEDFGYNLDTVADAKYLFSTITIYQVHGSRVNSITLFNPRISSFDHDTMSYDSSDLVEMTMSFDYEWVEYRDQNSFLTDEVDGDLKEYLGSGVSDYLEMSAFKNFAIDSLQIVAFSGNAPDNVTTFGNADSANRQSPLDLIKSVKKEAQGIIGYAASKSALFNQLQIDILGVDTPIIEAPSVREFSAVVNSVPTSYEDIRRVTRNIRFRT